MGRKRFFSTDWASDPRLIRITQKNIKAALLWPWVRGLCDDWARLRLTDLQAVKARVLAVAPDLTCNDIYDAALLYSAEPADEDMLSIRILDQHSTLDQLTEIAREKMLAHLYRSGNELILMVNPYEWFESETYIAKRRIAEDNSLCPLPDDHPWGLKWDQIIAHFCKEGPKTATLATSAKAAMDPEQTGSQTEDGVGETKAESGKVKEKHYQSWHIELAVLLARAVLFRLPDERVPAWEIFSDRTKTVTPEEMERYYARWAEELERMERIDKRTREQMLDALARLPYIRFWWKNVRSAAAFRKYFVDVTGDQIVDEEGYRRAKVRAYGGHVSRQSPAEGIRVVSAGGGAAQNMSGL